MDVEGRRLASIAPTAPLVTAADRTPSVAQGSPWVVSDRNQPAPALLALGELLGVDAPGGICIDGARPSGVKWSVVRSSSRSSS